MKELQEFLRNFFANKGQQIFISLLVAKICAFLGSLFIIRLLPQNEFGVLTIVASVFAIFAPFSGFGSQQSLLRFGSITDDISEKKSLAKHLFFQGLTYQILLSAGFLLLSIFYVGLYDEIFYVFVFFTIRLIGFYFFNHIQSELRIFGNNSQFAQINNAVNICGLIFLLVFTYFFGLNGYLFAIAITPFLALFWYKKDNLRAVTEFAFAKKELWTYGLHASGTALLSDTLFSLDVLLLSFLMNESAVANYKVAILLPANITFLALTFMQSDFPVLARNYRNKRFLRSYIVNYYKIFVPLSMLIFGVGFFFRREILHLFFSERYAGNSWVFAVLLLGFCLNMLLRNLYGNLLSAVGKMKINTAISIVTLVLLGIFGWVFVTRFQVFGMALSLSLSMLIGGFAMMVSFYVYFKNLN